MRHHYIRVYVVTTSLLRPSPSSVVKISVLAHTVLPAAELSYACSRFAPFSGQVRSPFVGRDSRESRSQITTESFKPAFGHSHHHQLQTHTVTRGPSVKRMRRGRSRVQVVNRSLRGSGSHSKRRAHSTSLSSREANPAREVQPALNTLLPPSHRLPSLLIIVIIVIIDDGGAARAAPPSDLTRSSRARLGVRLCSLGSGCGHRRLGQRALRRETWRVRQCLALASLRG